MVQIAALPVVIAAPRLGVAVALLCVAFFLLPQPKPRYNPGEDRPKRRNPANSLALLPPIKRSLAVLGSVDKFEPVSGGSEMDHSEEAVAQLIVAGGDGAVDLEVAEHALNAVALLVERTVMLDLHAAVVLDQGSRARSVASPSGRAIPLR